MKTCPFCQDGSEKTSAIGSSRTQDAPSAGRSSAGSRRFVFIRRIMPIIGLALVPKCPMCLAAYVAAGTGVGLSIATATFLRTMMIAVCVVWIVYVIANQGWRRWRRSPLHD